jgi:hypothetical protein
MGLIDDEISTYFALGVFSEYQAEISERIGKKYRKNTLLKQGLRESLIPLSSTNIPEVFHKGASVAIKVPKDLVDKFIMRIIKGFHTLQTGLIVGDDFDIIFFDYSPEQLEEYRPQSSNFYQITGVVSADSWVSPGGEMGIWWIEIYNNSNYVAIVAPKTVGIKSKPTYL